MQLNCVQLNLTLHLYHQIKKMKDPLHLSEQVCFPVYSFAKEIINQYRPFLEELELTYPQYLVMMVLWEFEQQTVNQIGEKLKLDSGTLTPLLKRLEMKEFVTRIRSIVDERIVNIKLTEKGKALKEKASFVPTRIMKSMDLSMEDLIVLKNIISKISKK